MNGMKHTPGPWQRANQSSTLITHEGVIVAEVSYDRTATERQANANLIAAAPELLEALQLLEFDLGRISPKVFDEEISEQSKTKLKAAITKATGGGQ